jgi:hypothetical protein
MGNDFLNKARMAERLMIIKLVIDSGEFIKALKGELGKGVFGGEVVWVLLGFVALVCVWVYFCCCSGGCLCQGLQELGLCTVGKLGASRW